MAARTSDKDIGSSDLMRLVGYNMKRAYMRIYQDFIQELQVFDLRQRTFAVMSLVIENPGISQSDIARSLGIERSGTVVIVDELEQRNLIRRTAVRGDKRAYALKSTAAGRKLYKAAMARAVAHEDRLLGELSASERDQLSRLLQRIHLSDPEGS